MKEKLASVNDEGEPAQTQAEIAGGMLSKKSIVVLARQGAENDPGHDLNSHNATPNDGFQRLVEEQAQQLDSQWVITADQATTILEMQSELAATNKVISEMKGELNEIYRIIALGQHGGSGMYVESCWAHNNYSSFKWYKKSGLLLSIWQVIELEQIEKQ